MDNFQLKVGQRTYNIWFYKNNPVTFQVYCDDKNKLEFTKNLRDSEWEYSALMGTDESDIEAIKSELDRIINISIWSNE